MRVGLACVLVCVKVDGHHVHARAFLGAPGEGGRGGVLWWPRAYADMELEQPHRDVVEMVASTRTYRGRASG